MELRKVTTTGHDPEVIDRMAEDVDGPAQPPVSASTMEVVQAELRPLFTAAEAHARVAEIRRYVNEAMVPDVHIAVLPGSSVPTLLKPGAELLNEIYGLVPDFTVEREIEDFATPFFFYRVKCVLTSLRTGAPRGSGYGQYSSGSPTALASRWIRRGEKQMDVAFICNAVLKMAMKSAHIDATLRCTRSSGLLTQDIEDLTVEDIPDRSSARPVANLGTCPDGHPLRELKFGIQCVHTADPARYPPKGYHNWRPPRAKPAPPRSREEERPNDAALVWSNWKAWCAKENVDPDRLSAYLDGARPSTSAFEAWLARHPNQTLVDLVEQAISGEQQRQATVSQDALL